MGEFKCPPVLVECHGEVKQQHAGPAGHKGKVTATGDVSKPQLPVCFLLPLPPPLPAGPQGSRREVSVSGGASEAGGWLPVQTGGLQPKGFLRGPTVGAEV